MILGVCQSVTRAGCAKTDERSDVLLGVKTPGNPRNIISNESPDFSHRLDAAFVELL